MVCCWRRARGERGMVRSWGWRAEGLVRTLALAQRSNVSWLRFERSLWLLEQPVGSQGWKDCDWLGGLWQYFRQKMMMAWLSREQWRWEKSSELDMPWRQIWWISRSIGCRGWEEKHPAWSHRLRPKYWKNGVALNGQGEDWRSTCGWRGKIRRSHWLCGLDQRI